jgi:hypothetical protein
MALRGVPPIGMLARILAGRAEVSPSSRGEFTLSGLRNRDVQPLLYTTGGAIGGGTPTTTD